MQKHRWDVNVEVEVSRGVEETKEERREHVGDA